MTENTIGRDRLGMFGDDFYAMLMAAHQGLTFEESSRLNAKLVLLLANEVGDPEQLKNILAVARDTRSEA